MIIIFFSTKLWNKSPICNLERITSSFTRSVKFHADPFTHCKWKSWRQHPTKQKLYGYLPPVTKTIKIRRTRHAVHCWRSRDELVSDVLLWIPSHGRAKTGCPPRIYIQQLFADTGCSPEDLPKAMDDREEWWERGSEISVLISRHDDDDDDDEISYKQITDRRFTIQLPSLESTSLEKTT